MTPLLRGLVTREDLETMARKMAAIGSTSRIRIITMMVAQDQDLSVTEIEELLGNLSQPTISHHLNVLKQAGLASATKDGVFNLWRLNLEAFAELATALRPPGFR